MKNFKPFIAIFCVCLVTACTSEPAENLKKAIVETTPETDGALNPAALFNPSNSINGTG